MQKVMAQAQELVAKGKKKGIWFNHEYILMKSDDEIANLFAPIVANNGVEETLSGAHRE